MTPIETTYEEVKDCVAKTANAFFARHGGDREELLASANYYYCLAYQTYEPERCESFEKWVCQRIWYGLLEERRESAKRNARQTTGQEEVLDLMADKKGKFDRESFFENLSVEARLLARLVLDVPESLGKLLNDTPNQKQPHYKSAIRKYAHQMGMTRREFQEAAREIQVALQGV